MSYIKIIHEYYLNRINKYKISISLDIINIQWIKRLEENFQLKIFIFVH